MAHRLLTAPTRRLERRIRLPVIQRLTETVWGEGLATMMDPDSLRRTKTSQAGICTSPLTPIQTFAISGIGQPNTPTSMAAGLRVRNAPRAADKGKGASAGV